MYITVICNVCMYNHQPALFFYNLGVLLLHFAVDDRTVDYRLQHAAHWYTFV